MFSVYGFCMPAQKIVEATSQSFCKNSISISGSISNLLLLPTTDLDDLPRVNKNSLNHKFSTIFFPVPHRQKYNSGLQSVFAQRSPYIGRR